MEEADWYSTGILFPLIVGIMACLAAALLLIAPTDANGARIATLDGGVGLLALGAVVYFLVGLWLIPSTLVSGGFILLGANVVMVHLPAVAEPSALLAVGAGVVGLLFGLRALWTTYGTRATSSA
ncbi:MAG: hypothetical protein L3J93_02835 [Thermoplasmata archaeon]|nr:hypothetical protein [Thermoplasmata archaeon]